jgi:hypothetical protein
MTVDTREKVGNFHLVDVDGRTTTQEMPELTGAQRLPFRPCTCAKPCEGHMPPCRRLRLDVEGGHTTNTYYEKILKDFFSFLLRVWFMAGQI